MSDPIVANVKEEHLGDFAFYFKEALIEYASMFFTVDKVLKQELFPVNTDNLDQNFKNKQIIERQKEDFSISVSDQLIMTDRLISIAERKVREKYPEEYDL